MPSRAGPSAATPPPRRPAGREAKQALQGWLVRSYSADRLPDLPPVTEDEELLSFEQARRKADRVLAGGVPEVLFPLRLTCRKVSAYRALKASAFVFQTPEQ